MNTLGVVTVSIQKHLKVVACQPIKEAEMNIIEYR